MHGTCTRRRPCSTSRPPTLPSPTRGEGKLLRRLRDAAVGLRPAGRVLHEFFDFLELALVEFAALLGHIKHVPPGGERVQGDTEIAEDFFTLGKDVVEEEHEDVVDGSAGGAQRFAEI